MGFIQISIAATTGGLAAVKGGNVTIAATFFAVDSTIFSWLLLRGRMIPVALAWLGVIASVLLVVGLPLQLQRTVRPPHSIPWGTRSPYQRTAVDLPRCA